MRVFFRCSLSALTNYFQFTDFFCDCTVLCVFCCYAYVSIIQCSMTRTVVVNTFQILLHLFRAVPYSSRYAVHDVLHGNGLTFAITCTLLWTISCLVALYVSVQARVYCTSNFTCAFFTRAFHTCGVYMPVPLPAQSIPPKMTITRSFITRALSHPAQTCFRTKANFFLVQFIIISSISSALANYLNRLIARYWTKKWHWTTLPFSTSRRNRY